MRAFALVFLIVLALGCGAKKATTVAEYFDSKTPVTQLHEQDYDALYFNLDQSADTVLAEFRPLATQGGWEEREVTGTWGHISFRKPSSVDRKAWRISIYSGKRCKPGTDTFEDAPGSMAVVVKMK